MVETDVLVVGSGLTGATIARLLHDQGYDVLVLDRRPHLGGNVHDHKHASGILVHTYGPHYFRTSSDRIWKFVNRFADFWPFAGTVKSMVDGCLEDWPVTAEYLERTVGLNWKPEFSGSPRNFEEAALAQMPRMVYEKFVRDYTEKQWGVPAQTLEPGLAGRFDVRHGPDRRLKTSTYQGLPKKGYAAFMESFLAGIPAMTGVDFLKHRDEFAGQKLTIYTGPIDEFFGFDSGRLGYRSQRREHQWLDGVKLKNPAPAVNYPSPHDGTFVREIEWKHMMQPEIAETIDGTLLTHEHPFTPSMSDQFEYPFPDDANRKLYATYAERAEMFDDLLICGRLGEYRYYDMDQAIGRAMALADKVILPQLESGMDGEMKRRLSLG